MELHAPDSEIIDWIRRLDTARLVVYTDAEIWAGWKGRGEAIVSAAPKPENADIILQAKTLSAVVDAVAGHINQARQVKRLAAVAVAAVAAHDWHRHGKREFCHGCGLSRVDAEIIRCPCAPNPNVMQDIESQIRTLTVNSKEASAARIRMRHMDAAEKTGHAWTPKGTSLFPVERWPRRYADVVGGWNKRAVK